MFIFLNKINPDFLLFIFYFDYSGITGNYTNIYLQEDNT